MNASPVSSESGRVPRRSLRGEMIAVAFIGLPMIVVLPWLNHAGVVDDFTLNLWGKYLCFALLAISVDLLWGYTGLLSLGQALFFSLGGYMLGMHLMLMIGDLGVYAQAGKNPNLLPDFMVFLGHTFLPSFWRPFHAFGFALLMVLVVPGLLAFVFGYLAFRSRIRGVYFSILTQALTYGAALMFFRNDLLMGGNNGFTDFKRLIGADLRNPDTQRMLYLATAVTLLLVYVGCRILSRTKFGLVQRAIRDGENRVLFSGYAAAHYKLFIFVLSAIIASIGGALYVPQVGGINPSVMTPDKSLEAVVWVAVGGRGTLVGPIVGAIGINALKSWATRAFPDLWLVILGLLFIIVVLFLPGGIVSLPARCTALWRRWRARPAAPELAAASGAAAKVEENA
ncbi:MAG TPA: urea ABC transporter permease subunit UrtC [Candidatus Synoicihabitans sp.]|nr:urea ABC transporter permease subunit UrtC [Candidatus Synoicihabitans sp.]